MTQFKLCCSFSSLVRKSKMELDELDLNKRVVIVIIVLFSRVQKENAYEFLVIGAKNSSIQSVSLIRNYLIIIWVNKSKGVVTDT